METMGGLYKAQAYDLVRFYDLDMVYNMRSAIIDQCLMLDSFRKKFIHVSYSVPARAQLAQIQGGLGMTIRRLKP